MVYLMTNKNNKNKGEIKMTKLTKKLFLSIMTLVLVVMALGTSTFAWFSMNTTATATGMQVGVKSDATYLLIGTGDNDTYSEIQTASVTTVALTVAYGDQKVLASKPKEASEIGTGKLFATGTPVTDAASAATAANWYTASSSDPAYSTENASHESVVKGVNSLQSTSSSGNYYFNNYVIKKTVYLTLSVGSNDAYNLTVTPTIALKTGQAQTTTDISAVKVLVASGDNYVILDSSMTTAQSLYATTNQDLTPTSVVTVDIYIYYDGSEDAVYSNNAANLADATIDLQFDVAIKPAA